MPQSRDFQGMTIQTVVLGGREFRVGPLTMGMRRRIAQAIAKVPPPPTVTVDVQGLVEAMFRPSPASNGETEVPKPLQAMVMAKAREDVKTIVSEMVREQVALRQQWPPMIENPAGQDLIFNNPDVQDRFVEAVLTAHNPDLKGEEIPGLIDAMGAHEFLELHRVVFSAINAMDRGGDSEVPKLPDAGGEPAWSPPLGQDPANLSISRSSTQASSEPVGAGRQT